MTGFSVHYGGTGCIMNNRTPSYCHHKGSGQAVVRIDGKDRYLGKFGSEESRREYDRLIAEWLAAGRRLPAGTAGDGLTINELLLSYWRWAEKTYRDGDGAPTRELDNLKDALRPLRKLYGDADAARFGPMALRTVREDMIAAGLCRRTINTRIGRLKRVFRWAVSYELLPAPVYEALRTIPGLQRGRGEARDTDPIKPVPDDDVRATLPFLPAVVAAMAEVQLLTGCRVSEALNIARHRPEHERAGLDLQAVQAQEPQPRDRPSNLPWSPGPSRRQAVSQNRPTGLPVQPRRRDCGAGRTAGRDAQDEAYSVRTDPDEEGQAEAAAPRPLRPQQLPTGHPACLPQGSGAGLVAAATQAYVSNGHPARYGVEAAKVILGHTKVETTQIYAERDLNTAEKIMAEIG